MGDLQPKLYKGNGAQSANKSKISGTLLIHIPRKARPMSEVTLCKGLSPVRHPHQRRGKKSNGLLLEILHMEQQCIQLNSIYLLLPFLLFSLRPNLMILFLFPETCFLLCSTASHIPGSGEVLQDGGSL